MRHPLSGRFVRQLFLAAALSVPAAALLALVAEGRARGFDAESAARGAARRRVEAIRRAEGLA